MRNNSNSYIFRTSLTVLVCFFLILSPALPAEAQEFKKWLKEFKQEAQEKGISSQTLAELEEQFVYQPEILPSASVDQQAEFSVKFKEYRQWFVNETMIEQGAEKYRQLSDTMTRIEQVYEIPGEYLLAIWGIESRYGNHRYEYDLLSSLTTMAYGHPRSADYFRSELLSLLQIHEELDFSLKDRRGSWAGAMGQPQFLPSTYQNYAVDFTGTGWADIWNSEADILASIANYIAQHGWNTKQGCARSLEENEQAPPGTELITPGDTDQLRFAVTDNFHAIYNYNHSNHYALTVCQLAEAIGEEIKENQ